jgi:hypothetical protein
MFLFKLLKRKPKVGPHGYRTGWMRVDDVFAQLSLMPSEVKRSLTWRCCFCGNENDWEVDVPQARRNIIVTKRTMMNNQLVYFQVDRCMGVTEDGWHCGHNSAGWFWGPCRRETAFSVMEYKKETTCCKVYVPTLAEVERAMMGVWIREKSWWFLDDRVYG